MVLILEIPTGVLADRFGRKRTIQIGYLLNFIGILFQLLSLNSWFLIIGAIFTGWGLAFISGAQEALLYDTLIKIKKEESFSKIIEATRRIQYVGYIIAVPLGLILYNINIRLPYLAWGVLIFIAFCMSFLLVEDKVHEIEQNENRVGIKESIREFKNSGLALLTPLLFSLLGFAYFYDYSYLKQFSLLNLGLMENGQTIFETLNSILVIIIISFSERLKHIFNSFKGLLILGIIFSISFLLNSMSSFPFGLVVISLILILSGLISTWLPVYINKKIESDNRATILSMVSIIEKLPYLTIGWFIGSALELGNLKYINIFLSLFIIISIVFTTIIKKKLK